MLKAFLFAMGLGASAGGLSTMANAQAGESSDGGRTFYVGGIVGDRLGRDQTFRGANLANQPRVIEARLKDGVLGGLVLGAVAANEDWGRLRVETELSANRNSLKRLALNGTGRELLEGRRSITSELVNVVYDTPKLANLIRLSVGGGIGAAAVDYDIRYNVGPTGPAINIPTSVSGHLAWQAIGGASVAIGPRVELTSDVRYFRLTGHQVERFNATAGTLDSVLRTRHSSIAATAGFRFFI